MRTACLVTLVIALAGCNKPPQDVVPEGASQLPAVTPAAGQEAPADPVVLDPNQVTMRITPLKTDNCEPKKYTAEVSWSIPAAVPFSGVEVRIGKPEGGGLLAYRKARVFSQKTGPWVQEGTAFFLVDKDSRKILAQANAGPYDCQ